MRFAVLDFPSVTLALIRREDEDQAQQVSAELANTANLSSRELNRVKRLAKAKKPEGGGAAYAGPESADTREKLTHLPQLRPPAVSVDERRVAQR